MPTISCNCEPAKPIRGFSRFSDPVVRRLGSFLLLVIILLLPAVVGAESQTTSKDAVATDIIKNKIYLT
jgi:hypothetical protein